MSNKNVKEVQKKILETMKYIDSICREHNIEYFIMGGTALGAIRHGGFIPWDDDLDIFMTPDNYKKFRDIFNKLKSKKFVLQEWRIVDEYLEYAKVRMNGTTFIEEAFKDREDMHHGIYVDIMILHKCPKNEIIQKVIYCASKYVTLVALSKRNWKPKNIIQKISLGLLKMLPNKILSKLSYWWIYRFDNLEADFSYCYFITKAKFKQGVFGHDFFSKPEDIVFEDAVLMGPSNVELYLSYRYGDYMRLPSKKEQESSVHAFEFSVDEDYKSYFRKGE